MPKQTFFNLPEEKRERILGVAVREFADKGYKQASVSAIVLQAGIAKGSFYQYFQDKDDLYCHIVRELIGERKMAVVQREKDRLEAGSLTEFLRVVFRRQMEEFLERPELLKIGLELGTLAGEPIYQKVMAPYQGVAGAYFLPVIQREIDRGEIDPGVNPQLLNFMLISLGQYLMALYADRGREAFTTRTMDRIVDDLDYILSWGIYGKAANPDGGCS